jgi:hypothetical protein
MIGEIVIDLDADIVPDEGLGGLHLRTTVQDLMPLIDGGQEAVPRTTGYEATYKLEEGIVEAAVDTRNGKVFRLTAHIGYRGKLFGTISVGMRISDAMVADHRVRYDEIEECVVGAGVDGVAIEVPEVDPIPETVPSMPIHAISVYAREIWTAAGQAGRW